MATKTTKTVTKTTKGATVTRVGRDVLATIKENGAAIATAEANLVGVVRDMLTKGMSVRGMLAAVVAANGGHSVDGWNKTRVGRLRVVAAATSADGFPTGKRGEEVIKLLLQVGNLSGPNGGQPGVQDTVARVVGGMTMPALRAHVKSLSAAEYADKSRAGIPNKSTGADASDKGDKGTDKGADDKGATDATTTTTDAATSAPASAATTTGTSTTPAGKPGTVTVSPSDTLAGAGLIRLAQALTARIVAAGTIEDQRTLDALHDVVEAIEAHALAAISADA